MIRRVLVLSVPLVVRPVAILSPVSPVIPECTLMRVEIAYPARLVSVRAQLQSLRSAMLSISYLGAFVQAVWTIVKLVKILSLVLNVWLGIT